MSAKPVLLEVDDLDEWIKRDGLRLEAGLPLEPEDPALFTWFEDLRLRPELLEPPPVVIPRLAWRGRLTVLAADLKLGKSTLAGQGVAAMQTGRPFLDGLAVKGNVLWLAMDEPMGDLVRRLESFGARGGVALRDTAPNMEDLLTIMVAVEPALIVVDSLTEFLGSQRCESVYDPVQVQRALAPLRNLARKTNTAILFLHHVDKARGKSADSRQIGAMADVTVTMSELPGEPEDRLMECKGRGMPAAYRKYRLAYEECAYRLVGGGELSLEARVLLAVQGEPGLSKNKIRQKVGGRKEAADAAIGTLQYRGGIVNRGTAQASAYYPSSENAGHGGARSGHTSGHTSEESRNSFGANDGHGEGAVMGPVAHALSIERGIGHGPPGDPETDGGAAV